MLTILVDKLTGQATKPCKLGSLLLSYHLLYIYIFMKVDTLSKLILTPNTADNINKVAGLLIYHHCQRIPL